MAMDSDSDDCEHRLLPQFLTDDDDELFADLKTSSKKNDARNTAKSCFGMDYWHEFGYGLGPLGSQSGLSSPLEGSTETESDDDDYITGLTQQLAHSTFEDSALTYENNKLGWGLSSSPQSTLCSALCGGCGCYHGSSRGSPNCPSKAASPAGINKTDAAWDLLLYAAAGEVARMRVMEGATGFYPNKNGGLVGPPTRPSTISVPQRTPSPSLGFRPDYQTHLSLQQHLKVAQFEQLRQQQMMRQQQQQQQAMGVWGQAKLQFSQTQQMMLNSGRTGGKKPNLSMAAWPTLEQQSQGQQQPQQHPGSGMRAVFLGNPNSKRECAGTGVFLPRRFGTPAVARKKSGCSTVLLPDRVVQTLNLNLNLNKEGVDVLAEPTYSAGRASDYDAAALRYRNSSVAMGQQRGGVRQQPAGMNQVPELRLPQEWSY